MRDGLLEGRTDSFRVVDMQAKNSRTFRNLGKIGIDEVCARSGEVG